MGRDGNQSHAFPSLASYPGKYGCIRYLSKVHNQVHYSGRYSACTSLVLSIAWLHTSRTPPRSPPPLSPKLKSQNRLMAKCHVTEAFSHPASLRHRSKSKTYPSRPARGDRDAQRRPFTSRFRQSVPLSSPNCFVQIPSIRANKVRDASITYAPC